MIAIEVNTPFSQITKEKVKGYSDLPSKVSGDTLFLIYEGEEYEIGVPAGYINQHGDTVIPIGKYKYCFMDSATRFLLLVSNDTNTFDVFACDLKENRLYEVYWFDNGPDYFSSQDGLFRILRNGKIGYANEDGIVVIKPQFECAEPFYKGKAKVTLECEIISHGNHSHMNSDQWYYIDRTGSKQ